MKMYLSDKTNKTYKFCIHILILKYKLFSLMNLKISSLNIMRNYLHSVL